MPFNSLSSGKNLFACYTSTDSTCSGSDYHSSVLLKYSPNLELLVNQFNNATPKDSNDPENISLSKYYDNDEIG